jgi:UDP-N-acetylglucosamine transferase subunit ALG13
MVRKHIIKEVLFEEMIFVTVGTTNLCFDRLIKKMDEIAGRINEEIIMQIGNTKYKPINAQWFAFLDDKKMLDFYNKADVIIAHDGAGTLLISLSLNKPIVVVPRLKKYDECGYGNKFDLAETLGDSGRVIVVYDVKLLEEAIEKAKSLKCKTIERNSKLISFLREYINTLDRDMKDDNKRY